MSKLKKLATLMTSACILAETVGTAQAIEVLLKGYPGCLDILMTGLPYANR